MNTPTRNQCLYILTHAVETALRDYDDKVTHFDIACGIHDTLAVQGYEITRTDTSDPAAMQGYVTALMRSLGEAQRP